MTSNGNKRATSYLDWSSKGRADLWRYIVGAVLGLSILLVFSSFGSIPFILFKPDYQRSLVLSIIVTLLNFVIAFFAIPLMVQLLHRRPFWSVAMPRERVELWNFGAGFVVSMVVGALVAVLFSFTGLMPIELNPQFRLSALLPLIFIGFVGIFIQAGSEEMLFRGYLTQFVRRFTANPYLFVGIPALLFALPHILNVAALGGTIFAAIPYLIAGLFYGWAAYKTGSLWMSLGLHLSNNFSNLVLIGTVGDILPSAAPFQVQAPGLAVTTLAVAAQTLAVVAVLVPLMRRRAQGRGRQPESETGQVRLT